MTHRASGVGPRAIGVANLLTHSVSLFEDCDAQNGCGPLTPNAPLLHHPAKCALSLLDEGGLETPKDASLTHTYAKYSFNVLI